MAGIATASKAQVQTARDALFKAAKVVQDISQGPLPAPKGLAAAQISAVNTALTAASAALTAIATSTE